MVVAPPARFVAVLVTELPPLITMAPPMPSLVVPHCRVSAPPSPLVVPPAPVLIVTVPAVPVVPPAPAVAGVLTAGPVPLWAAVASPSPCPRRPVRLVRARAPPRSRLVTPRPPPP